MLASARSLGFSSLVMTLPLAVLAAPGSGASAASSRSDGTWGPTEVVADATASGEGQSALVRVRAGGSAVAAWKHANTVMVARRGAAGHWTAPAAVSPSFLQPSPYDLAVGPDGAASVVWQQRVGGQWRVEESHLSSGDWTSPRSLAAGTSPRTTIDGRGTTTVVWSGPGVRSARRQPGGGWRLQPIVRNGTVRLLKVGSNADGDVVAAWHDGNVVRSSLRPHGGRWTLPHSWAPFGHERPIINGLQAGVDGRGRALVVWSTTGVWKAATHEYGNYVAWARSTQAGSWSPVRKVTGSLGEDGGDLDMSMNASGSAVAVWFQVYRSDSPAFVWAARFRPAGAWSAPLRISPRSAEWPGPRVWLDAHGEAHAFVENGWGRILAFHQSPGASWSPPNVLGDGRLADADGRGVNLVVVYGSSPGTGLHATAWTGTP
jgi:hypothetical protein